MDQLPAFGTALGPSIGPTAALYTSLLSANAEAIGSTMKSTHRYGQHARQDLDVYRPSDFAQHATAPILLFVHGGGFVSGAKSNPAQPELIYANLGHYFADTAGYVTVVINYRLVGQHDAAFPSGGADVGFAVDWIRKTLVQEGQSRDLFLMGNSAGGVHVATWVLWPSFKEQVEALVGGDEKPLRLRGVVFLSTPLRFKGPTQGMEKVLEAYFGEDREGKDPLGMLQSYQKAHGEDWPLDGVQFLAADAELDPDEEVRQPTEEFLGQWLKADGQPMKDAISYRSLEGHNHISPVWSLGTGIEKEEHWAGNITGFVDSIRRSEQIQKDMKMIQDSIKR